MKYLDDDGTGVKPKNFLQRGMRYTSIGDPIQEIWEIDRKIAEETFGRKRKPTGFIYLPGSKLREAEGHLLMRSCIQDAVYNSAPSVGKYINKLDLYRQCPSTRVKDTKYMR